MRPLFEFLRSEPGRDASTASRDPLSVFADVERTEAFHRQLGERAVVARLPIRAACQVAELWGQSEAILINPSLTPFAALPRDIYPCLRDAVVGYTIGLRPLREAVFSLGG